MSHVSPLTARGLRQKLSLSHVSCPKGFYGEITLGDFPSPKKAMRHETWDMGHRWTRLNPRRLAEPISNPLLRQHSESGARNRTLYTG